jgi:kinetochore protein NNF1
MFLPQLHSLPTSPPPFSLPKSTPTLTSTAKTRPHLLSASQILAAHLSPTLTSTQSQLNAKLQTTQSQNATLYQTILEQRAEIECLMEGLEGCVRDLEEADGKLAGEVGGLNSVVREVREVEMGGV